MVDELHAAPPDHGVEEIQLPGERAWRETCKHRAEGIPIEPDTIQRLEELGTELGVSIEWD